MRLRLLGPFAAAEDTEAALPIRLSTKKGCALLAFLATAPGQAATREQLATLLWGDSSDRQARHSLRQALVFLRKELNRPHLFETDSDVIRLQSQQLSVDALEFEALSDSKDIDELGRAVGLAQGEFLEGFSLGEETFEDWLRQQRHRFNTARSRVLETYAQKSDVIGQGVKAIGAIEQLLALDPLREDWQRLALRLYARHRSHNEALAQAKLFTELLHRELDAEPEPQTLALIEDIRRGAVSFVTGAEPLSLNGGDDVGGQRRSEDIEQRQIGAGTTENSDIPKPVAMDHRQGPSRYWPSRIVSAGVVLAVVLAIAAFGFIHIHPFQGPHDSTPALPSQAAKTNAPVLDPWRSPQRLSQSAGDAIQPNGAIIPIAVFPFTTYGETEPSMPQIADMIWDDLINNLSRVPALRVISRQTIRSYRGQSVDIEKIGTEFGVRYILEGSLRKHGDKLRINLELVDSSSRLPIWSARLDRGEAERYDVQDEIVARLARELHLEIFHLESMRDSTAPEVDTLNYKGFTAIMAASNVGLDALKQAKSYFTQALERNPQSAAAKRGLGAYHALVGIQMLSADSASHLGKAETLLQEAILESPNVNSPYFFLGLVQEARLRLQEALELYERSVAINPSYAPAYGEIGHLLISMGRAHEALDYIHYALRLSPRDPHRSHWLRFAGEAELELLHFEQSIRYLQQSYELNSRHPLTLRSLAAAYAVFGKIGDAHRYLADLKLAYPHISEERLVKRPMALRSQQPQLLRGLQLALSP